VRVFLPKTTTIERQVRKTTTSFSKSQKSTIIGLVRCNAMLRFGHANDDSDRGTHYQGQKDKGYLDLTFKFFVKLWGGALVSPLSHNISLHSLCKITTAKSSYDWLALGGTQCTTYSDDFDKNNLFSEV
jgi:hypothetical protein